MKTEFDDYSKVALVTVVNKFRDRLKEESVRAADAEQRISAFLALRPARRAWLALRGRIA